MIVLTDHLQTLVDDIVSRLPDLAHIKDGHVLVFARSGRRDAAGPVASCHCVARGASEPGYFFWEHCESKRLLRRTPYVVRQSPTVVCRGTRVTHLVSVALPRFCDQWLDRLPKRRRYRGAEPWVAKLDTLIHELYHIDPSGAGLRQMSSHATGRLHTADFYRRVAELTQAYLDTRPQSALTDCLRVGFDDLVETHGSVLGRVFSTYPSYPREFWVPIEAQLDEPRVPITAVAIPAKTSFDENDLRVRSFFSDGSSRAVSGENVDARVLPAAA